MKNKSNEMGCNIIINTLEDNPIIISKTIGIEPSELIVKGEAWLSPFSKKIIPNKFNEHNLWIYKPEKYFSKDGFYLNDAIKKTIDILDINQNSWVDVFKKYPKSYLLCYSYFYEKNPYFKFDKDLIERLVCYKINIEFDIYCL